MKASGKIREITETETQIVLDRDDIVALLKQRGVDIGDETEVKVSFEVGISGDYRSGDKLELGDEGDLIAVLVKRVEKHRAF